MAICAKCAKAWITNAHDANGGLYSPLQTNPKHKGISAFIVDMHGQGVSVGKKKIKSVKQPGTITFEDARIPKSQLLGPLGAGFKIARPPWTEVVSVWQDRLWVLHKLVGMCRTLCTAEKELRQ